MNNRNVFLLLMVLACALLLTACASTKLTGTWQEESYSSKSSRLLILGMTSNQGARQIFEAKLAGALKMNGLSAYPGYAEFNYDEALDKDTIVAYVKKNNIDSVLVTKLLDAETYTQRVTAFNGGGYYDHFGSLGARYGGGWYGDYRYGHSTTYETDFHVYHLETSLYTVDGEKMVWSAFTTTETLNRNPDSMNDLITLIVKQLKKDGLI